MSNKLLLVGVSAVVIIAIIVVLAFVQDQVNRAAAQKLVNEHYIEEICDAGSQVYYKSLGYQRNYTQYYDCLEQAGKN